MTERQKTRLLETFVELLSLTFHSTVSEETTPDQCAEDLKIRIIELRAQLKFLQDLYKD